MVLQTNRGKSSPQERKDLLAVRKRILSPFSLIFCITMRWKLLLVVMCFYFISGSGMWKAVVEMTEASQEQRSTGFGYFGGIGFFEI